MKKWISLALAAGLALATAGTAAADKLKVGFVYVGPIGDHGWTYQHNEGRLAVEKAFGDKVETVYVEKVSEGPDAERAITRLARQGRARRHLEQPRRLGRHETRHGRDGPLHQHAGRCESDGRSHPGEDHQR